MKRVLLASSAILAVVPGLASLAGALPTPPGHNVLFGAIAEALGVGAILLLWVQKRRIQTIPAKSATHLSLLLVIALIVSLGLYFWFYNLTVVSEVGRGSVFLPLVAGERLQFMIDKAGSRQNALIQYGKDALIDAVQASPGLIALTTTLGLVLYQIILAIPVLLCCGLALRTEHFSSETLCA